MSDLYPSIFHRSLWGFFFWNQQLPVTLDPGASCTIMVTFSPTFVGETGGLVIVSDDALGFGQQMSVVGTGK